jgi:hypothetical protein
MESPDVAVLATHDHHALVTDVTHKKTARGLKSRDVTDILPCPVKDLLLFLLVDLRIKVIPPRERISSQGIASEASGVRQDSHIRKSRIRQYVKHEDGAYPNGSLSQMQHKIKDKCPGWLGD